MDSIKATGALLLVSLVLVAIMASPSFPAATTPAQAAINIFSMWLVAFVPVIVLWLRRRLFESEGNALHQYNYSLALLLFIVVIAWF